MYVGAGRGHSLGFGFDSAEVHSLGPSTPGSLATRSFVSPRPGAGWQRGAALELHKAEGRGRRALAAAR